MSGTPRGGGTNIATAARTPPARAQEVVQAMDPAEMQATVSKVSMNAQSHV